MCFAVVSLVKVLSLQIEEHDQCLEGFSLTRCLALLDPLDATAELALHLCLGACAASLHRGRGVRLTQGCPPWGSLHTFPSGA